MLSRRLLDVNNLGIRPINNQVVLRADRQTNMSGGLHLPQTAEIWPNTGQVLDVGPDADPEIVPGCRVFFKRRPMSALIPNGLEALYNPEWEGVVMLRDEDIEMILDDDVSVAVVPKANKS